LALDEAGRLVTALARNGSPGIEIVDDWSGMGQRTTASGTVTLTDVEVQPDHVIESWRIYEEPRLWTAAANLSHLALDVGIARDAFEDGLAFLRTRARPWYESGVERAVDDPLTLMRVGQLAARLHAVEEMLSDVGRLLDTTAQDTTDEGVRRASLSVARATALTNDVAVEIGSEIFAFSGASSTDEAHNLSRHWRNARTHTVHAAGRWRYHRVGDFFLNGRLPPTNRTN
jgi:alkylation response protein AidB-like acyl-CoA dehydrogenase